MHFTRNHSTRDFIGTAIFGPVIIGIILLCGVVLWAQGEIPVSTDEPLSILGVGIMVLIFFVFIGVSIHRLMSPWFIDITGAKEVYTFTAQDPKDNIIIKKTNLVSAKIIHQTLRGATAYGADIIYLDNGAQRRLVISGAGSWRNQSGVVFRQKKFCEALVAGLTDASAG